LKRIKCELGTARRTIKTNSDTPPSSLLNLQKVTHPHHRLRLHAPTQAPHPPHSPHPQPPNTPPAPTDNSLCGPLSTRTQGNRRAPSSLLFQDSCSRAAPCVRQSAPTLPRRCARCCRFKRLCGPRDTRFGRSTGRFGWWVVSAWIGGGCRS
jgi:hypothetical protein